MCGYKNVFIAEKCYYDVPGEKVFFSMGGEHTGWKGIGNEGSATNMNDSQWEVFVVPYTYTTTSALEAKTRILSVKGGAGNKCYLLKNAESFIHIRYSNTQSFNKSLSECRNVKSGGIVLPSRFGHLFYFVWTC